MTRNESPTTAAIGFLLDLEHVYSLAALAAVAGAAGTHGSRWYLTSAFTRFVVFCSCSTPIPTMPYRGSVNVSLRRCSAWGSRTRWVLDCPPSRNDYSDPGDPTAENLTAQWGCGPVRATAAVVRQPI
jgi:hypothetical protein